MNQNFTWIVPPGLDKIADEILAYHPKIKTKAAKRRARRNKRAARMKSRMSDKERMQLNQRQQNSVDVL
jgi:hypothetical protein